MAGENQTICSISLKFRFDRHAQYSTVIELVGDLHKKSNSISYNYLSYQFCTASQPFALSETR